MIKMIFILFITGLSASGCGNREPVVIKIAGEAQGTTYHISYLSEDAVNYQPGIDSILKKIDSSLSTYLPASLVSRINRGDSTVAPDQHFTTVFSKAEEIAALTDGAFDITVAPLVNAWGFGFTAKETITQPLIDSLLALRGHKMVRLENGRVFKEKTGVMLDFNAIAQGYTVDVLAAYLESKKISRYFVELGGEVKAKGKKDNSHYWKVGIDRPMEDLEEEHAFEAIVGLNNKALATSGSYRKFYVENGRKYSHFIDPATGYPAKNNLLSASVMAEDCMTADAYATAFMVMGMEKAKQFLAAHPALKLDVFFIYDEKGKWATYITANLKSMLAEDR